MGRKPIAENLVGQRFGRLLVLERIIKDDRTHWECVCDCGTEKVIKHSNLKRTLSCGCYARESLVRRNKVTRPVKDIPGYYSWDSAKSRTSPTKPGKYYLKGIRMCERYRASLHNLIKDIGERPTDNLQLDRIDNDSHYSCGICDECKEKGWKPNVRWVTCKTNRRNTSVNNMITWRGETRCLSEWCELLGMPMETIRHRLLYLNWPIEKAFTTPIKYYHLNK